MFESRDAKDLLGRRRTLTAYAEALVSCGGVLMGLRDLQTFAKCPVRLHVWHVALYAGQCLRPPGWKLDPHPRQDCLLFCSVVRSGCDRRRACTVGSVWLVISAL